MRIIPVTPVYHEQQTLICDIWQKTEWVKPFQNNTLESHDFLFQCTILSCNISHYIRRRKAPFWTLAYKWDNKISSSTSFLTASSSIPETKKVMSSKFTWEECTGAWRDRGPLRRKWCSVEWTDPSWRQMLGLMTGYSLNSKIECENCCIIRYFNAWLRLTVFVFIV